MYYEESQQILDEIKKAKRIFINCHEGADPDSLASALALKFALKQLKKTETEVIAPDKISQDYFFLEGAADVPTVNFSDFDFQETDLLFMIDSEHWGRVGLSERPKKPYVINLDHHAGNRIAGNINIVDSSASCTSEILYKTFSDLDVKVDSKLAFYLLAGILSDTGFFQFMNTNPMVLRITANLIETGANYETLVLHLNRSFSIDMIKYWGEVIKRIKIDKVGLFAWSAVPYEVQSKYKIELSVTSTIADMFLRKIKGVKFAIAMAEKTQGKLNLSFRVRESGSFDISPIARELGGGGHADASGASVEGLPFNKAVKKVLQVARKYAKEN